MKDIFFKNKPLVGNVTEIRSNMKELKDANDIVKSEIKEIKDIFSQNEPLVDTVKKNTASVQKMHGTTLKSYAHFASKTDDLKIQTDTKISNIISSIQDLKDETNFEMREL